MHNSSSDSSQRQITRRNALKLLGAGAISGITGFNPLAQLTAGEKRPNIIFILTDDHRYDALSFMNHPFLKTPNLDRIASEGVVFENAFVTTSLCSPSRASFLTGQYAHTHGVVNNFKKWSGDNISFMELLKSSGYDTAFIGKWHMSGESLPEVRGIDHFITFTRNGGQGVYFDCPLYIDGVRTERPGKYINEDLTDFALDYIDEERDNPFCLFLSHKAVHLAFKPPKHLDNLYDGVDLKLPPESNPFIPFTDNHAFLGALMPLGTMYRNYCETVVSVDEQVGRVLAALDNLGIADDTIIIYAGDNGFFWGEHGLFDKRYAYEESIRIPFLMRYPRLAGARGRRSQMVLNIDLAPTLLDLAGVEIPDNMQGQSLVSAMQSPTAASRESWLYEYFPEFPTHVPGMTAVRTNRYKYTEYQNRIRPPELYDLEEDPKEMSNLLQQDSTKNRQLKLKLKQELERLKAKTGYRFTTGI